MNKLQFIDLISKYQFPANDFIFANKVEKYHTNELQGIPQSAIEQMIFELLQDDICFVQAYQTDDEPVIITDKAIQYYQQRHLFDFTLYDLIGLTAKGGKLWEAEFQPNWLYYPEASYDDLSYNNPMSFEIICQSKDLIRKVVAPLGIENVDTYIKPIACFNVSYWKQLNPAYCLECVAETLEEKQKVETMMLKLYDNKPLFCEKTKVFW